MKKETTKKENQESKTEIPDRSAKSVAKYLRISPRKVRLVINTIRYQPAHKALGILMSLKQKAARMAEKVLKSAVANAKVLGLDVNRLYVSEVRADGGPTLKRFMSRSMGRADRIIKRTTHLSLKVKEGHVVFPSISGLAAREAEEPRSQSKKRKQKAQAQV